MDDSIPEPGEVDILVVEDSPTQAKRLRRVLEKHGYRTRLAQDGNAALQAFREGKPDLVLSDVLMPDLDGFELCRAIKADIRWKDTPVILLTSLADPKDILHGLQCGADNFIRKPCADGYLLQRIEQVLANHRLRRNRYFERGLALYLGGEKHVITAAPQQILDLLVSSYEQAVNVNEELQAREHQISELNERLAQRAVELERINAGVERKNIELQRASGMKTDFVANVSHELRTPLNAIIGFTDALLTQLAGSLAATQERQPNTVARNARHLLSLINDLLDLAKIESGKIDLRFESVSCAGLLDEVAATMRPLAEAKGLSIEVELPEQDVVLHTDRRSLSQIVINLAANAVKFTETGRVRLELSQHRHEGRLVVEVRVVDTGVGIRPEDHPLLFQAFTQFDSGSAPRREGTGLGLHLSQRLAQLIGGSLGFQSEPGKGSVFIVTLPGGSAGTV
jgi:two-component system sensor histidine kinase/response regulator